MQRRSWVLVALAAALVCAGVAYAATRTVDDSDAAEQRAAVASSTSSTTLAASPSVADSTTSVPTSNPVPSSRDAPGGDAPPFESVVTPVTAAELGASWHEGCPVPPEELRALDLSIWNFDGAVRQGRLVVHAAYAERIVAAFGAMFSERFPVERMTPIDAYDGDDQASMRANNTSGFNCRFVAGTSKWSEHAFGRAIDLNPLVNPYVKGSSVDPPEGAAYADRRRDDPGMIHGGDAAVRAFAAQGWKWGGYWSNGKDYQHFSATGR
ncbi:MAG: M15 family metallopeptidase [Acidimicrobiales bacterium]